MFLDFETNSIVTLNDEVIEDFSTLFNQLVVNTNERIITVMREPFVIPSNTRFLMVNNIEIFVINF